MTLSSLRSAKCSGFPEGERLHGVRFWQIAAYMRTGDRYAAKRLSSFISAYGILSLARNLASTNVKQAAGECLGLGSPAACFKQLYLIFLKQRLYLTLFLFSLPCSRLIRSTRMHRFLESSACRSSELHQPTVQLEYRMQSLGRLSATSSGKICHYFL